MLQSKLARVARALLLVMGCGLPIAAMAQDISAQIRERVEQLRDAGSTGPSLEGVSLNEGVARFYEQRDFAPAWVDPVRREALISQLRGMADDGLNPQDYELARLERGPATGEPAGVAAYDVTATRNYVLALAHLFRGKVDPASLEAQWNFDARTMTPDEALHYMVDAVQTGNIAGVFDGARPSNPAYARLRAALAKLREQAQHHGWPRVAGGPTLVPGMADPRVKVLRRRLAINGDLAADDDNGSDTYDAAVEAAVKHFQDKQYLEADGTVGPGTLAALNVPVRTRIGQLRANLERGRWLLHQLHDDFVLVDIAGFEILYFKNVEPVWRSRVQVGKPFRNSPVFTSKIGYVKLNPTWTVPPTVLREDFLPKLQANPDFLEGRHIRIFDGEGQELAPRQVNWARPGNITLRQDAGPDNSLGRALLRFPNPYAEYLHDTPHRELFSASQRAFSSGCIRVEHIEELVRLLLRDQGWEPEAIDAALAGEWTQSIKLDRPVPVLLGYWTVDVPADGSFAFKADIYERDPPLLKALDELPDK